MSSDAYYQSRAPGLYGGTITLIIVAAVAVALRLTARKVSAANFWWDDWTLVIALIFDFFLSVGYWVDIRVGGLGRHTVAAGGPIDEHEISNFFKAGQSSETSSHTVIKKSLMQILLAIQILYFSSAVAIKISLILLYYRIFGVVRWFRWLLAVAWTIVLLYYIIALFIAIFECTPVAFYWDKTIAGGTCINENGFYRWNGVANLLIDFMILCLTMPMVWRLELGTRQKISLSCIFLLGLFASIASIIRVTAFSEVDVNDVTYTYVTAAIFTPIEQSMGIICACLPTLRPLIRWLRQSSKKSSHPTPETDIPVDSITLRNLKTGLSFNHADAGDSRVGFARLPGDIENGLGSVATTGSGEATVTTYMGTSPSGFEEQRVGLESILRQQTLEQHHGKINKH